MNTSAEQQARDMLERMGVEDAQSWSAGEVVELANLIADRHPPVQPTEPVVEALRLILPLAKGYMAAHPIESNIRYVHAAEAALAAHSPVQPTEPPTLDEIADLVVRYGDDHSEPNFTALMDAIRKLAPDLSDHKPDRPWTDEEIDSLIRCLQGDPHDEQFVHDAITVIVQLRAAIAKRSGA